MTSKTRLSLLLATLPLLAACGGGGGSGYSGPVTTNPPTQDGGQDTGTPNSGETGTGDTGTGETGTGGGTGGTDSATGPKSMAVADLVAFADLGRTVTKSFRSNTTETWSRTQNCDGTECVVVDRLPGATGMGLVSYTNGSDAFLYSLMGTPVPGVEMPSGIYNGDLSAQYRRGADGDWIATIGEMNLLLDMETGEVLIGGILAYPTMDGASSIQFFGEAMVVDGAFKDEKTMILVDSAGTSELVTEGTTSGILASGTDADAIFGLVEANDTLNEFYLKGGFIGVYDPRY